MLPSDRDHTLASMLPSAEPVIWGYQASCPAADKSTGADQVAPESVLVRAWMIHLLPLKRLHTLASRVPSAEPVTWGWSAFCPAADKLTGVDQVFPESVLVRAWMIKLLPLNRLHTLVSLVPSAEPATWGK